ncbi:hypothetical protein BC828DRAFT_405593 [Blastocladiella britannica]|nr:hypothetical protein BC828DRAFT_405593 [Blastocladiella britannica]
MSLTSADPIYCREQIKIPQAFPDILKNYSKHIIRTQPADIVAASAEYFHNLSRQQDLGRQTRLATVTREQLESLYLKFSSSKAPKLAKEAITKIAAEALVPAGSVQEIFKVGSWESDISINWIHFWALSCTVAAGTLHATLLYVIDMLASNGSLPVPILSEIVQFLAKTEGTIKADRVELETITEEKALESIKKLTGGFA